MGIVLFLVLIVLVSYLAYNRSSALIITVSCLVYLVMVTVLGGTGFFGTIFLWLLFAAVLIPLNVSDIRMAYVVKPLYHYAKNKLPTLSDTEEEALQTGTSNWDGELFSGNPNWASFLALSKASLSDEEKEFIDTKVEELAGMVDPWEVNHEKFEVPKNILDYIKKHGFLGFGIPKKYGGLEFSDFAHSQVLIKIGSRQTDVNLHISVPNSLGPAELIHKYGTDEQKKHYLPRLAKGIDMPCFALTAPLAGSDASGMIDRGIVEKGMFDGKEIIGIRLNFSKRYITLAPITTLVGLAFKLYDPDHLMGDKDEYGITCALIPDKVKGLKFGRRHCPIHQAFSNGPISGKDVFIPLDYIIGGPKMAGKGWRMLMECLAVGRAISIPTGAIAVAKSMNHATALYSKIRRAFRVPIGNFEGIQEKLAENAGLTYISDSLRLFTMAGIDRGEKPAVPSAISKCHATEMSRRIITNAIDVHGGKGIMMGPNNYVARAYEGACVGVTVEGSNILTRNMIIFGQGGIRCHPYLLKEMLALRADNTGEFEPLIMGHIGFTISNAVRSFILGLTDGYFAHIPAEVSATKRYFQQLTRMTAAFAFLADTSMILMGGKLKFKESLSARLGDGLSMLYMLSAVLKRHQDEGQPAHMLPVVEWSCQYLLAEAQKALDGVIVNFPIKPMSWLMRIIVFPMGRCYREPADELRHKVANLMLNSQDVREHLAKGIYSSEVGGNFIHKLENTVKQLDACLEIENRILKAQKDKVIFGYDFPECIKAAKKEGIITTAEEKQMTAAYNAMMDIINVDDFDAKELSKKAS